MSRSGLAQRLPVLWYQRRPAAVLWPLLPLSWLFRALAALRRGLYRIGVLRAQRLAVPVIVVGNLTVGGSGKTPLVLWLVDALRARGLQPGIISRGYGGSGEGVRCVDPDAPAGDVGDEPLLLARRSRAPVFVGRDRVAAGAALLAACPACDVIIADDGLQHYRLARDAEIVVFDGRAAGNRLALPAGPLREPLARLRSVTAVVWNSAPAEARFAVPVPAFSMRLESASFHALGDPSQRCTAEAFRGRRLFALAGIGDPSRFFAQLAALGLSVEPRAFPDHHAYTAEDLAFARDGVLLMTEKDAVKCAALCVPDAWVLPVTAHLDAAPDGRSLPDHILEKLNGCASA
ncbi:tetraacyldisaccharide 4'-kinase [Propionivibrio dicarboxylicus]|uniref:Tetraacyldisaccharide 4'-kinase n=1 Tax=Propionivibrio dicarboxylicus TaxID=83767 RepID=A0A1G8BHG1_9RHOO|nr:tetraacyldisaccharide 4'-kinase [Propionivibrio dicarboxylicus]SDH32657.1 lipid-A-disaccharide kinase [Propionivibrio dicarboxylicus]